MIVTNAVPITLESAVTASCSANGLCSGSVDALMGMLDHVLAVVVIGGLPGIGVGLPGIVNANVFA